MIKINNLNLSILMLLNVSLLLHTNLNAGNSASISRMKTYWYTKKEYTVQEFFDAIKNDYKGSVEQAIFNGFDLNQKNKAKLTPLLFAAKKGKIEILELLADEYNVDINQKVDGFNALHLAAAAGHEKLVDLLIEKYKLDPTSKNNGFGWTPLHLAASNNQQNVLELLLEKHHVNPDLRLYTGSTILHLAAQDRYLNMLQLLLDKYHLDLNLKDSKKNNIFHCATIFKQKRIIKVLLKKYKMNPNEFNDNQRNGLINILTYKENEVYSKFKLKNLLSILTLAGADLETIKTDFPRAYDVAKETREIINLFNKSRLLDKENKLEHDQITSEIKSLIKNGASIAQIEDLDGNNILHYAISSGNIGVAEFILFMQPKLIAQTNDYNQTPFELAIGLGYEDFARKLLLEDQENDSEKQI